MRIILTEMSSTNESNIVRKLTKENNIILSKDLERIYENNTVLFIHGALNNFSEKSFLENNKCKIFYVGGGYKDDDTNKFLSWKTFVSNIEKFINHIKDKDNINEEDINLLYGKHSDLESLHATLATVSPLSYSEEDKANMQKLNEAYP